LECAAARGVFKTKSGIETHSNSRKHDFAMSFCKSKTSMPPTPVPEHTATMASSAPKVIAFVSFNAMQLRSLI
jgi:hypothetical protein